MRKLKVNILSPGRFHVLDLARELDKNGFDVKFYSYVPTKRAAMFGLPSKCNVSFLWLLLPILGLYRITKRAKWTLELRRVVQDIITATFMRKCDILISMSGEFHRSNLRVKKEGGIVIIERGSKHILEQKRILESIPSLSRKIIVSQSNVEREIADYELADFISIAAQHVKNSFIKHGYPETKLFVNPYGVELSMFKPLPDVVKEYDLIMTGGWCYRKGCDILVEAIKKTNFHILHVGNILDVPFPDHPQFTHVDKVNQPELINYYNKSRVFVLPSREEGMALVQAQAVSCNLPIVGSPDSGAEDFKKYIDNPQFVNIVESLSVDNVVKSIYKAVEQSKEIDNSKKYAGEGLNNLTWEAYGKRYAEFLKQIELNHFI